MAKKGIRRLLVIDKGKISGIITSTSYIAASVDIEYMNIIYSVFLLIMAVILFILLSLTLNATDMAISSAIGTRVT